MTKYNSLHTQRLNCSGATRNSAASALDTRDLVKPNWKFRDTIGFLADSDIDATIQDQTDATLVSMA